LFFTNYSLWLTLSILEILFGIFSSTVQENTDVCACYRTFAYNLHSSVCFFFQAITAALWLRGLFMSVVGDWFVEALFRL